MDIQENDKGIVVYKQSTVSGKVNSLFLPMAKEEFTKKYMKWDSDNLLIQEVFPEFSPEQREFIKSGITPDEWNNLFL